MRDCGAISMPDWCEQDVGVAGQTYADSPLQHSEDEVQSRVRVGQGLCEFLVEGEGLAGRESILRFPRHGKLIAYPRAWSPAGSMSGGVAVRAGARHRAPVFPRWERSDVDVISGDCGRADAIHGGQQAQSRSRESATSREPVAVGEMEKPRGIVRPRRD